jgi:hypothetical protein
MENPFSTPSLPTMDDRQEKILDYMECLEEQAQSLAHSARGHPGRYLALVQYAEQEG